MPLFFFLDKDLFFPYVLFFLRDACKKKEKNHLDDKFSKRPPWLASKKGAEIDLQFRSRFVLISSDFSSNQARRKTALTGAAHLIAHVRERVLQSYVFAPLNGSLTFAPLNRR